MARKPKTPEMDTPQELAGMLARLDVGKSESKVGDLQEAMKRLAEMEAEDCIKDFLVTSDGASLTKFRAAFSILIKYRDDKIREYMRKLRQKGNTPKENK
jgi:uncharacterized membrane protein YqiK